MAALDNNHYLQKALLNHFAKQTSKKNHKICVLDLFKFDVYLRNTTNAFQENKLYDLSTEETKALEKKFNTCIEQPMSAIMNKCISNNIFDFERREIEIIKKYILLQLYRTPNNLRSYTNIPNNSFELSHYNRNEGESPVDFWKREMLYILDHSFDSLLDSEMVGVKNLALEINSSFLMFLHTNNEFCINDLGYATERIPISIPKSEQNNYIQNVKELGKQLFGINDFDRIAKLEIEGNGSYIDNFILFPISSNIAILVVSPIWKYYYTEEKIRNDLKNTLRSVILCTHFSLPTNKYVNGDKIKTQEDLIKYKNKKDLYKYSVQEISKNETIYLNILIMNEALRYIGIKTPKAIIPSINEYNELENDGTQNLHHNYKGFIDLLNNIQSDYDSL